jgi:hypothetical protein
LWGVGCKAAGWASASQKEQSCAGIEDPRPGFTHEPARISNIARLPMLDGRMPTAEAGLTMVWLRQTSTGTESARNETFASHVVEKQNPEAHGCRFSHAPHLPSADDAQ